MYSYVLKRFFGISTLQKKKQALNDAPALKILYFL